MMTDTINASSPVLVGQGGSFKGHRWSVQDQLVLGRDDSCDIVIASRQVSRKHSRVYRVEQDVYLEDLSSKNGTYCNGERITGNVLLSDGDVIQIALAQEFVFLSKDATVPLDASDFGSSPLSIPRKLRLDPDSHRVFINNNELAPPLSALQFKLLAYLYKHEGAVVSRDQIIDNVWGEQESMGVTDQALDALIRRLRERLESAAPDHDFIVTIRGQGFRLDNPTLQAS